MTGPAPHPAALPDDALLAACEFSRTRDSGPGGQRRNKVETTVVLRHRETGLAVRAADSRSAEQNRRAALRRLRLALAVEVRRPWTGPSPRWRTRSTSGRVVVAAAHADLPALLAELLDALAATGWDGVAAAETLGASRTSLVRLAARHPPALAAWNAHRRDAGLGPLRD